MYRIVYSPSVDKQKEAEKLAKDSGLPIVIGDNEHTKNIDFDRQKVQILFVPKEKVFDHPKTVKKLFACPIGYTNDWFHFDCELECTAQLDEHFFKPIISYMESHHVKYIARFPKAGVWKIILLHKGNVIEQSEIHVV
jgi:predicted nucleotide-binding protein (sugar kinase/HSP70/actin superfamily)